MIENLLPELGPETILIVDDNEDNLFTLKSLLEQENRHIITAKSGSNAIKATQETPVELVLLDVQMPQLDGFEIARLLQSNERTAKVPIILVTAIHKTKSSILKGLRAGAIDYIFKPLDIEVTRAKVSALLKMYRQQKILDQMNLLLRQFEVLVQASDTSMILLDQDHAIRFANESFEEQFLYSKSAIVGQHFFDLFVTDYDHVKMQLNSGPADKSTRLMVDGNMRCSNGRLVEMAWELRKIGTQWTGLARMS